MADNVVILALSTVAVAVAYLVGFKSGRVTGYNEAAFSFVRSIVTATNMREAANDDTYDSSPEDATEVGGRVQSQADES